MTKNQLERYEWIIKNNQRLRERIEELETEATRVVPVLTHDPKAPTPEKDKMARIVAKIVDCKEKLADGEHKVNEVKKVLENLDKSMADIDPRLEYILRRRYEDGVSWPQIRAEVGVSEKQIHNLHNKALKIICRS